MGAGRITRSSGHRGGSGLGPRPSGRSRLARPQALSPRGASGPARFGGRPGGGCPSPFFSRATLPGHLVTTCSVRFSRPRRGRNGRPWEPRLPVGAATISGVVANLRPLPCRRSGRADHPGCPSAGPTIKRMPALRSGGISWNASGWAPDVPTPGGATGRPPGSSSGRSAASWR